MLAFCEHSNSIALQLATTHHVSMVVSWTEQAYQKFPLICISFFVVWIVPEIQDFKVWKKTCHHEKRKEICYHHWQFSRETSDCNIVWYNIYSDEKYTQNNWSTFIFTLLLDIPTKNRQTASSIGHNTIFFYSTAAFCTMCSKISSFRPFEFRF